MKLYVEYSFMRWIQAFQSDTYKIILKQHALDDFLQYVISFLCIAVGTISERSEQSMVVWGEINIIE